MTELFDKISKFTRLTKRSANYIGLCPFHKEETPSFLYHTKKDFYHCFGCGISGGLDDFNKLVDERVNGVN